MTSLCMLPELARSFLSLWSLLLCVIGIFAAVLAVVQKRYRIAALSLIPFACSYSLWQVLFDLHLFGLTADVSALSRKLGAFSWISFLTALFLLTLATVPVLIGVLHYGKRRITPGAVKLLLDQMPCGICCWRHNGRVLFSNVCMNRLCAALTNGPLRNGNLFRDAVSDGILTVEGKVWRFSCRDIVFDGEKLHEMIASDITAEYAKTQTLEQDKAELSRLKRELQAYGSSIEETVRRQEILQAKVNIHDEMNKLMLSTMAAEKEDAASLDRIFSLWEQNALLLCMDADAAAEQKAEARISDLAAALGICLTWRADLPPALTQQQRSLFFAAAQEAVINASKHAGAKQMEIVFEENETTVCCTFVNDGNVPAQDVRFVGGLANLAILAREQDAVVSAEGGETFTLSLRFPKRS